MTDHELLLVAEDPATAGEGSQPAGNRRRPVLLAALLAAGAAIAAAIAYGAMGADRTHATLDQQAVSQKNTDFHMTPDESPDCVPEHSLGQCQPCLKSEQCHEGSYCCPYMKKCVATSSDPCRTPIANCRSMCYDSMENSACNCENADFPAKWQQPTCGPNSIVPQPPQADCDESFKGDGPRGDGAGYRGCQTKTRTGRTCQPWTKQNPHTHSRTAHRYPGSGLGDHNYCRNPDGEDTIWCYTTDPKHRWEFCDPVAVKASCGWKVKSGSCKVDDECCLTSPGFPNTHNGEEACKVDVSPAPGTIVSKHFETEAKYDILTVNDRKYSGTEGPDGVEPTGQIVWASDHSVHKKGFKLCLPQRG